MIIPLSFLFFPSNFEMTRTPVSNAQVLEINWSQLLKSKGRSDGSSDLNVSKGVLIAAGAVFLAALGEVSS